MEEKGLTHQCPNKIIEGWELIRDAYHDLNTYNGGSNVQLRQFAGVVNRISHYKEVVNYRWVSGS